MGESLIAWRVFFRTTDTDVFEFIDKAITIVTLDCPKDVLSQRGRIAERLFSCEMTRARGDCSRATKESKANSDMGNVALDVMSIKYSHGEAEVHSDIEETSQLVGQVLRIKRVWDNSRHESDESLKRFRSMSITLDILKIGISVNNLQKKHGSKQIAQLARDITMCWKAMVEDICRRTEDVADPHKVGDGTTSSVKNQNIRKPGQVNEAGPLVNRSRRLNVKQHKGTVKPNMSSNTNSRTIPASDIASRKFERIKGWDEVVADVKFQATKRKMQELYQKAETD